MNSMSKCPYCGLIHAAMCGLVKAMEYHPDGSIKRVEFKTAADYPQQVTTLPPPIHGLRGPVGSFSRSAATQSSGEENNCEQDEGA